MTGRATRGRLGSWLADPRATLLLAAIVIEGVALCLWPALYLANVTEERSGIEAMFSQRYGFVAPMIVAVKGVLDTVFPGALWTWEALIGFVFECMIAAYVAYALAAWRASPRAVRLQGLDSADTASAPSISLRWVLIPLVVFQLTLVVLPGTMTTDIYNYAMYGEMPVLYRANPFIHTPQEFPQSPLYYLIPLYWHDAPSVYGPFWVDISVGVASAMRRMALADELLAYRLIANVAHLVNAWLVWRLARRIRPADAPAAAIAYAWNPLLLVEFALNGHNDVLMLTLALASLLLASGGRHLTGALSLGLSVATKYTSVLVAPMLLVWSAQTPGSSAPLLRRLGMGPLVLRGTVIALSVALLYLPWLQGIGTLGPVLYWVTGPRINDFWPTTILTSITTSIAAATGADWTETWSWVFDVFKVCAKVALVALIVVESWRVRTLSDVLAASARVLVFFLLVVNTWVMPWYFAWPVAFSAALGWRNRLTRVSAGLTLTAMIVMYQHQWGPIAVNDRGGAFLVLPILLALAHDAVRLASALIARRAQTERPSLEARPAR